MTEREEQELSRMEPVRRLREWRTSVVDTSLEATTTSQPSLDPCDLAQRYDFGQRPAEASKLPILGRRVEILDTVAAHQVSLLTGPTGCGKSTQVLHLHLHLHLHLPLPLHLHLHLHLPLHLQVGGIYTVIRSKTGVSVNELGDQVIPTPPL